jgi:hypothetical protein
MEMRKRERREPVCCTLGAAGQGAEVGATDQGAEPGATSAATSCHAGSAASHLGAKIHGAKTCYLGAELRVIFRILSGRGLIVNFFRKRAKKKKKVGARHRCLPPEPRRPTDLAF